MSVAPIALRGVARHFAGGRGVAGIDLTVDEGAFVALVGPSGAGKTTLLRLMASLDAPDEGQVLRYGEPRSAPLRGDTRVALVFQRPRLLGCATALDNALAGRLGQASRWRALIGAWSDADRRIALEALDRVGLLERALDRADRLSGGEQQRVSIARALVQQPRVLLADEPVASLDTANARAVLALLRRCADEGLAVVASLHQPELAREFCDRVVTLEGGRLRWHGTKTGTE